MLKISLSEEIISFHDFLSDLAAELGIGGFFVFSPVVGLDVVDFAVAAAFDLWWHCIYFFEKKKP